MTRVLAHDLRETLAALPARPEHIVGGLISLIGLGLTGVHLLPLVTQDSLVAVFIMSLLPMVLSLVLVGVGVLTARKRLVNRQDTLRFAGWITAGSLILLFVGGWMLLLTVSLIDFPWIPSLVFFVAMTATLATLGGVTGAVIGLYDAHNREQTRRLRRQHQQLEQQNRRLDEFASFVSHDLRNPLNVAQLRIDLAQNAEDQTEHLDSAETALTRADELITDVLMLARQGAVIEDESTVEVSAVAKRAWQHVPATEATLQIEETHTVQADETRLQRVFENLFKNAIEHGSEDVTITVGTADWVGFYVEDTGPGLPETDTDQVFEMGYSTNTNGTGYGLAIVKAIVDAHDWDIHACTASNGGARFEFETDQ